MRIEHVITYRSGAWYADKCTHVLKVFVWTSAAGCDELLGAGGRRKVYREG